jgi:hypothetical protein
MYPVSDQSEDKEDQPASVESVKQFVLRNALLTRSPALLEQLAHTILLLTQASALEKEIGFGSRY